jgi:serine/threonine protein kinase
VNFDSKPVDQDIIDLIKKMLKFDPSERITFKEIYEHRIFKKEEGAVGTGKIFTSLMMNREIDIEYNKNVYQQQ